MLLVYSVILCLGAILAYSSTPSYVTSSHEKVTKLFQQISHPDLNLTAPTKLERNLHPAIDQYRYSAIINNDRKIIMCTIPKAACTQWRKLMALLESPELAKAFYLSNLGRNYTGKGKVPLWNPALNKSVLTPNVHSFVHVKSMNELHYMERQSLYNDRQYLKVIHVRNPVTRVLSAWLSKSRENAEAAPTEHPYLWAAPFRATFREFVEDQLLDPHSPLSSADEHYRPQHLFCEMDRGVAYDIYLKFEERDHWQPLLFAYLGLDKDPRFKINYMDPGEIDEPPSDSGFTVTAEGRHRRKRSGTAMEGNRRGLRRHSGGMFDFRPRRAVETRADDKAVILEHYSRSLLDAVVRLYQTDIDVFHYHSEVREIFKYFD